MWNLLLDLLFDRQTAMSAIVFVGTVLGAFMLQPVGRTVWDRLGWAVIAAIGPTTASIPSLRRAPGKEPFQRTDAAKAESAAKEIP